MDLRPCWYVKYMMPRYLSVSLWQVDLHPHSHSLFFSSQNRLCGPANPSARHIASAWQAKKIPSAGCCPQKLTLTPVVLHAEGTKELAATIMQHQLLFRGRYGHQSAALFECPQLLLKIHIKATQCLPLHCHLGLSNVVLHNI
jgi:hypothetical protein